MANNGIHEIPTKDTEGNYTQTTTGKVLSTCPRRSAGVTLS